MFDVVAVKKTKLWPELLPGNDIYNTIQANQVASPSPLDLRRFPGFAVELANISLNADANIDVEIRTDKRQKRFLTSALDSAKAYPYSFIAQDYLNYLIYNVGSVPVNNWRTMYGLWVWQPTVADKIKNKWSLTQEENDIANELGIFASVEKGVLPLPRSIVLEREYQVLQEIIYPRVITVPVPPDSETLIDVYTEADDEFLVLKGFTCSDVTFNSDIRINITRDEDIDYVMFRAPAIGNVGKVDCWIPALHEIRITTVATMQATNVGFTFDILVCRLTNTLKARWNLDGNVPSETAKKVKGGVL